MPRPDPDPRSAASSLPAFDWRLVRSFVAVLEAGSVLGAARALGMQQPTVSRHVAELESQLGAPLFERTGRGTVPTSLAIAIAGPAGRMRDDADALARALVQGREATAGTVRITTSQVAACWLMPDVLARLAEAEPGVQVELVASNRIDNLLRREADIAVRMARPDQATLVARKVADLPIVAAAHEGYLRRAGTPRRPEDLAGHRLIGYDRDDTIVRGMAAMGLPVARESFALRTDDQIAYGRLIACGAGIGFVAAYNLRHWPGVVPVLPTLRIPPLPCWLAVHREIRGSRVIRRVVDFLAEALPAAVAG